MESQTSGKPNIRVKLMRLTFYKNPELEQCVKREFEVEKYRPEWAIPYGVRIDGKLVYFSRNEVYVFPVDGAGDGDEEAQGHDHEEFQADDTLDEHGKKAPKQAKPVEESAPYVPMKGWSFGKKPTA